MSDNTVVYLPNVRLSFPRLVEPKASGKNPKPDAVKKYSADFILDPVEDAKTIANFMKAVNDVAVAKWKELAPEVMKMINADRKQRNYGNGSEKISSSTFKVYDGYEGKFFIVANSIRQPQMIQSDGTPISTMDDIYQSLTKKPHSGQPPQLMQADGTPISTMEGRYQSLAKKMYGGCRMNVAVQPWAQDNSGERGGKGIRCDLLAIQFCADDEPFGEIAPDVSGAFGKVASTNKSEFSEMFDGPSFI